MLVQDVEIKRVLPALGLIVELPTEPSPTPGFVHISNVSDAKVEKLGKVSLLLMVCAGAT